MHLHVISATGKMSRDLDTLSNWELTNSSLPIGSLVVPFWDYFIGSEILTPKRELLWSPWAVLGNPGPPRRQPDPLQGRIDSDQNAKQVKPGRWAAASTGRRQISQRPRLNSMPKQIAAAEHWALQSFKTVARDTE